MIRNHKEYYGEKASSETRDFNEYINDSFEELREYLSDTEILENMFKFFSVDQRAEVLDSICTDYDLNDQVGEIETKYDEEDEDEEEE